MRFDGFAPPRIDPRHTVTTAGEGFIARCMQLWDAGNDTAEIAFKLFEREHVVAWAVRAGREQRYAEASR